MKPIDPSSSQGQSGSVSLWQTTGSVLASFFGVQSSRNRVRDFERGKPLAFIGVGLLMTVAFIGCLLAVVHAALSGTGL
ncbi:MAG: DUF2970 domain-containing protein [Nevskia sp.]|nr:DUF2970 domain-containing protein [Nevskia sp.]